MSKKNKTILIVAVLLIAVVIAVSLIVSLTKKDDNVEPSQEPVFIQNEDGSIELPEDEILDVETAIDNSSNETSEPDESMEKPEKKESEKKDSVDNSNPNAEEGELPEEEIDF